MSGRNELKIMKLLKHLIPTSYMDVGDQKFISRSSEGFGTKTCLFFPLVASSTLKLDSAGCICFSSAINPKLCDKFCLLASKLDKIQPLCLSASTKGPVKYLLTLRALFGDEFGDVTGDAGKDLLPRRKVGLKPSGGKSKSWFSTSNPRTALPSTIWWATRTTELPHMAASPLKPSSTPLDLVLVAEGKRTC